MLRRLFKWLGRDEVLMILSICLFIYLLVHIVYANYFRFGISLEEKITIGLLLVGSLLWLRIEAINISKIDYNDAVERMEKLYYDQCRFERAICEKFNVVYRPDKNGLETFYDKDEYYEKEYQKAKNNIGGKDGNNGK